MPRAVNGSVYQTQTRSGVSWGIRWVENGRRPQRSGFGSEAEARAWFADNVLPRLRPVLKEACEEVRAWAYWRRKHPVLVGAWVYVIAAPDVYRLKIGRTSKDPAERLRALQTSSPIELRPLLVMPGDAELESVLLEATLPFAIEGTGSEWRTMDALEVVFALIRERGRVSRHVKGTRARLLTLPMAPDRRQALLGRSRSGFVAERRA